jgi:hypothetical protein
LGYPALLDEATRARPITYVALALHDPKSDEFEEIAFSSSNLDHLARSIMNPDARHGGTTEHDTQHPSDLHIQWVRIFCDGSSSGTENRDQLGLVGRRSKRATPISNRYAESRSRHNRDRDWTTTRRQVF